jgi:hypothetical protein
MLVSGASAVVCGVASHFASGAPTQFSTLFERYPVVALWAVSAAMVWLLWAGALRVRRQAAAGAALMLAPSLISTLIFVERLVGVTGPNPLVWPGVMGGSVLVVAGTAAIARSRAADDAGARPAFWLAWVAGGLALAGVAGLALPTMSAAVSAGRAGAALDVSWALTGWETVPGWVALSCAALLLAATLDGTRWSAAAALLAPFAYLPLISTPYHVLTRWLPSEVQVDFGTEYAAITFKALTVWPARVAVVGAALGLVVVLSGRAMASTPYPAATMPPTEE